MLPVCTILGSYLADLADSARPPDPTAPFQLGGPLSSVLDLPGSAGGQGEMRFAEFLRTRD